MSLTTKPHRVLGIPGNYSKHPGRPLADLNIVGRAAGTTQHITDHTSQMKPLVDQLQAA